MKNEIRNSVKILAFVILIGLVVWPAAIGGNNFYRHAEQTQDDPSASPLSRDKQYFNSGVEKLNGGDSDGALLDFKAAVKINPKLTEALFNIAGIYMEKCEWKKAQKYYLEYTFLVWDNSAAYRNLGICYAAEGNSIHSQGYLNKAIDMNPNDPDNFYARGAYRADKKHYAAAIEDFNAAIALRPKNGKYYYLRGQIYRAMGVPSLAVLDFDKAKELGYQEDNQNQ